MSDVPSECKQPAAEDDLVVRARTDREAFGALFDAYYEPVVRYCVRRLGDRAAGEDVTSEVFLQVATHLAGFPGRTASDFRRWLFRIATNAVNAQLRQTGRRRELLLAAAADGRVGAEAGSGEAARQDDRLDWPVVYEMICELDEREQSIVALRFFAACSYEEIADVVGISPGAARTALSRALAVVREKLSLSPGKRVN